MIGDRLRLHYKEWLTMKKNQITLSEKQKELIAATFRTFDKYYTPGMRSLATVVEKINQAIYSDESLRFMQILAESIGKMQSSLNEISVALKNNQGLYAELSKVVENIQKFNEKTLQQPSYAPFDTRFASDAENLTKINVDSLKDDIVHVIHQKESFTDLHSILAIFGFILTFYSTLLAQNSASKQDLEPIAEMQNQILTEMKKLEQTNLVLLEQNKQLQVKVDILEQNQNKCLQTSHSVDSDKLSEKSQQHSQRKQQHKLKE